MQLWFSMIRKTEQLLLYWNIHITKEAITQKLHMFQTATCKNLPWHVHSQTGFLVIATPGTVPSTPCSLIKWKMYPVNTMWWMCSPFISHKWTTYMCWWGERSSLASCEVWNLLFGRWDNRGFRHLFLSVLESRWGPEINRYIYRVSKLPFSIHRHCFYTCHPVMN